MDILEKRDKYGMNRTEYSLYKSMVAIGLKPEPQYKISDMTVDFAFPDEMLVIEVNGPYHSTEEQKERDLQRWHELRRRGWKVKSFKASSVHKYSDFIAEKIKEEVKTDEPLIQDKSNDSVTETVLPKYKNSDPYEDIDEDLEDYNDKLFDKKFIESMSKSILLAIIIMLILSLIAKKYWGFYLSGIGINFYLITGGIALTVFIITKLIKNKRKS